jgi:hypothetical protein
MYRVASALEVLVPVRRNRRESHTIESVAMKHSRDAEKGQEVLGNLHTDRDARTQRGDIFVDRTAPEKFGFPVPPLRQQRRLTI